MRMRGIEEGFREIQEKDPHTALTKTALRRLVTTGQIPSVKIGTKYLIDLDVVDQYFRGELRHIHVEPESPQYGTIRRLKGTA